MVLIFLLLNELKLRCNMEKEFLVEFTMEIVENGCFISDVKKCADILLNGNCIRTFQLVESISKDLIEKFIADIVTLLKLHYGIIDVIVHPAANSIFSNKSSIIFTEQNKIKYIQYYFKLIS